MTESQEEEFEPVGRLDKHREARQYEKRPEQDAVPERNGHRQDETGVAAAFADQREQSGRRRQRREYNGPERDRAASMTASSTFIDSFRQSL